jgi:hypothetical protein
MANIEVFSVDGKLLKTYRSVEDYIDLDLASGLYHIKLVSDNRSLVKKIIVN